MPEHISNSKPDAPRFQPEARRSWWLDVKTRDDFTRAAQREHQSGRMQRSRAGQMHHGMTIDHLRTGR